MNEQKRNMFIVHCHDLNQYPDGDMYITENSDGESLSYQVEPDTIGQYTGLKDKNGAEIARKQSIRQANDPNSKWGKGQQKRVWCVNNNKEYASMTEAANDLGLTQHQISVAINGNHKTRGYKFYKIT